MWIHVEHSLRFEYDEFIRESWLELRVEPRSSVHQTVSSFYLAVGPPASVARYVDWNDNVVHHFGVADFHDRIEVVTRSLVETHPRHPPLADCQAPPRVASGALLDFATFGGPVVRSSRLERLERQLRLPADAPLGRRIAALGDLVSGQFQYQPGVTHSRSSSEEVLAHGKGVCQDFAHLFLALLRVHGLACRYVSGYLHVERDSAGPAQSHAWIEAHDAERGWVAFDPTHNCVPDERYVVVAFGRSYDDVPPNKGVYRGRASERLHASVATKPAAPRGVVGLHEEIARIDVPVYREMPSDPGERVRPKQDEAQQQQQQQQQQQ